MANKDYLQYSINDFDNFDCLRLSKGIYFLLMFVLRGYLVWIISVANMSDSTSFIEWIFPETELFYLSLFSGCIGLLVLMLMSLRRPNAANWVVKLWPQSRRLLVTALIFDFLVTSIAFYLGALTSTLWLVSQASIVVLFMVYCFKSQRLRINLAEFPQPLLKN